MVIHIVIHFASSLQETNVLGFKGPRKMTVILPGMTAEHQRVDFKASVEHDSLIGQSNPSLALCVQWTYGVLYPLISDQYE